MFGVLTVALLIWGVIAFWGTAWAKCALMLLIMGIIFGGLDA